MIYVSPQYSKTLYFGDVHVPYHDPLVWADLLEFIRWWRPQTIYNLGDWLDFPQISKFDKDPQRYLKLQEDLDMAYELQAQLRSVAGSAEIVYIEGNHDDRWRKWLWSHPEVASLRNLTIQKILRLSDHNIRWVGILEDELHHGFIVEHGDRSSKHSAYTAKSMMEARGSSGISGHTHRFGSFYRTDHGGDKVWRECACICSRNPHYMRKPNWQNGWTVGYHKDAGRFELHEVPVVHGKAAFNTIEFSAEEA